MSPFKSLGGHQTLRNLFNRGSKFDSSGRFTSPPPPPPIDSSGGTAYNSTPVGTVHRFTTSGSLTINDPGGSTPEVGGCKLLVVGGGGAGGSFNPGAYGGGGGGGGGVRYIPSITLSTEATFPITVGPGGTGGNPYTTPNAGSADAQPRGGGNNSVFNSPGGNSIPAITATGGGAGGVAGGAGGPGGSGGGQSYPGAGGPGNAGGTEPRANPTSEGNPAGNNKSSNGSGYQCGGGGGANPSHPNTAHQTGNPGLPLPGVGSPGDPWLPPAGNVFGGGGGGSSYKETDGNGPGGPGGGGSAPGGNGVANTGGGGGGSGSPSGAGGNGGYGVVYVIIPAGSNCTGSPG